MAKQRDEHQPAPEDLKKKKAKDAAAEEEVLSADEAEVVEVEEEVLEVVEEESPSGAPKKPAAQPTKIGRAPQPTQLAKKSSTPTMLQADEPATSAPAKKDAGDEHIDELEEVVEAEESSKPPKKPASVPDMSLDEPAAQAEIADDDLFAEEEVIEAEVASAPGKKAPTPGVPADEDILAAEDVLEAEMASGPGGGPVSAVGADLDFLTSEDLGKPDTDARGEDRTELIDEPRPKGSAKADLEETVALGAGAGEADDSSAVDLGRDHDSFGSSSELMERGSGVDQLAEALESGVDLGSPAKKPVESDVDLTALLEEDEGKPAKKPAKEEDLFGEEKTEITEEGADKTAALEEEEIGAGAMAHEKAASEKEEEVTDELSEAPEEETEEEEEPVVAKKKGGTAVAERPRKPKYLRRWAGGFVIGLLLLPLIGAALWFFSPGTIEQGLDMAQLGHAKDYKKAKSELAAVKNQRALMEKEFQSKTAKLEQDFGAEKTALQQQVARSTKGTTALLSLLKNENIAPATAKPSDIGNLVAKALKEKKEAEKFRTDIAETLEKNKILDKDKLDDPAAFDKAVKDLGEAKVTLGAVNKQLEEAKVKDTGEKGVAELITGRKEIEEKLGAVDKALADAMVKAAGAKGVEELITTRKKLESERNDLDVAINKAYTELVGPKAAAGADPKKALLSAIKTLRSKAESPLVAPLAQLVSSLSRLGVGAGKLVQTGVTTAGLFTEVNYYRLREPFIVTPAKQLDTWVALLQNPSFKNAKSLNAALKDAAFVRSQDAKASAASKAKAQYVTALVLRNQEKYGEARQALAQAVKEAANVKGAAWTKLAAHSLHELTDSSAYYLPRAIALEEQGNGKAALETLSAGLKAIPNDARLLAHRGLLRLEMARSQGKPDAETQQAVRADVEPALKNPAAAAEGYFTLGQLEETLGDWAKAEDDYRKALKAHQGSSEDANRYRIALARLLLLHDTVPTSSPPMPPALKEQKKQIEEPNKEEDKNGVEKKQPQKKQQKKEKEEQPQKAELSPAPAASWTAVLLGLTMTALQPGADEEAPAGGDRLKESIDLANELIKSSNPKIRGQGYMLLGQARARQGKRTEGLKLYVKGMDLVQPGITSKDLEKMVEEHPAFQTPDSMTRPNAFFAERQFGQGLHHYWKKQYAKAEEHFNSAIGFFKQDARYYYFLGLARLHQKGQLKRDAGLFALEQGARLEADNHPGPSEVNLSLERVQGALRRYVDQFREKALAGSVP